MGSVVSQLPKQAVAINMSSPQAQLVQNVLKEHKVVIFSKTYCPYCTMAKDVSGHIHNLRWLKKKWLILLFSFQQFKKLSVEAFVVELDKRDDGDEIQSVLGQITGGKTVS